MPKKNRRLLIVIGATAIAVFTAVEVILIFTGRNVATRPLPNPNGYDELLKAERTLIHLPTDPTNLDRNGLFSQISSNTEPLHLLRLGLSKRCAVPMDTSISKFGASVNDLIGFKSLALVLSEEGKLAEIEHRPADAARSYLDAIHLGNEISRGGVMMDRLIGIACEEVGRIALCNLLPKLTCKKMQALVSELEEIDRSTVSWTEVLRNENHFARAQAGKFPNPIKLVSEFWQARGIRRDVKEKHELVATHLRLLTAELALRCYQCDHGGSPESLQLLVPGYLRQLPLDPFGGHPLVYRSAGTNWLLYSIGPDGVDDNGQPDYILKFGKSEWGGGQKNKGDVLYNSPW